MKKLLSLLLSLLMVLSFCACASDSAGNKSDTTVPDAASFMVGYGKSDVTPTESVPLMGYGTTERRMSTGLWSKLYIIAVAMRDPNGNTAIVMAADTCHAGTSITDAIRTKIEETCGVPADQILFSSCHQHSAPDMGNSKVPSSERYRDQFIAGAIVAAENALKDLAPATMMTNSVETENMNFVRHYLMEDGSYAGDNFGDFSLKIVDHESKADNEMQLVKFLRKGQTTVSGKEAKDIILINFQGHPHMGASAGYYNAHSDVIGVLRDELEAELDCQTIYFSGAGGNMNMTSRIAEENITGYDYKRHGKALAKYVLGAEDSYEEASLSMVTAKKELFVGQNDHSEDHRVEEAQKAYDLWLNTGDTSLIDKYGFNSQYHAKYVVSKSKKGPTSQFNIFVLAMGDLSFVAAPYEMFDTNGREIKDGSPFATTIITTISNGGNGYIPSQLGYDHGGYSVDTGTFAAGTGEQLRDAYLKMLNDLHGQY